jgi:hypothetical protein
MPNKPLDKPVLIHLLPYPKVFLELWNAGKWGQPDEGLLKGFIPWMQGPIEFIENMRWLTSENRIFAEPYLELYEQFSEYQGSQSKNKPDLPWIDREKAIIFGVNRIHGDDLAIAMDYRSSLDDPRVVGTYWNQDRFKIEWRMVSDSFNHFVEQLRIGED